MNLKKNLLLLPILAILTGNSLNAQNDFAQLRAEYIQKLDQEDNQLLNRLLDLMGVSQAEWHEHKKHMEHMCSAIEKNEVDSIRDRYRPLSQDLSQLSSSLLKLCGLDPSAISVVRGCGKSNAGALDKTIIINEIMMRSGHRNTDEIAAKILHEIYHIKKRHWFDTYCLDALKEQKTISDTEAFNVAMVSWRRFQERCADILAALVGLNYANGLRAYFERYSSEQERKEAMGTTSYFGTACRWLRNVFTSEDYDRVHPTDAERYAYLTALIEKMKACRA